MAHYGEALKPRLTEIKAGNSQRISDLLVRRSQLVDMRTMEKNRDSIMSSEIKRSNQRLIKQLQKEIEWVEETLDKQIKDTPRLEQNARDITQCKGRGKSPGLYAFE